MVSGAGDTDRESIGGKRKRMTLDDTDDYSHCMSTYSGVLSWRDFGGLIGYGDNTDTDNHCDRRELAYDECDNPLPSAL